MPHLNTKPRTTNELATIYRRMWRRSWHPCPVWFMAALRITAHCLAMRHPPLSHTPTPRTP
jgi:hypothetical protein